ncbi:MAG: radical SAM family heme chaperone HemW [Phycisphaeraceae bacterium]
MTDREFTPLIPQHQATSAATGPYVNGRGREAAETGLYVHIPFCFHKCHYCDFYSIVDRDEPGRDRQRAFTDALIAELRRQATSYSLRPTTIFIGGGTPTLLRADLWQRLLSAMREVGVLERAVEFTVEANPETVSAALLDVLVRGGVNRLSMGAQSFQPRLLKTLERWHEPASVAKAAALAQRAGIDNINLDLIFAIPGQTMDELDADLDAALALEPTHLSCYSLIFEPETPLAMKRRQGHIEPMDDETERAMYERVMQRLDEAGFEQYEISNWAKRVSSSRFQVSGSGGGDEGVIGRYRCKHNVLYWTNGDWIGVGPSAASHVVGQRWKNVPHLGLYMAGSPTPPVRDVEQLDDEARIGEQLMLGLRLREGVALDWLNEALPADHSRRTLIEGFVAQGLLEYTDTHLRLTQDGLFVADGVVSELL